MALPKPGFLRVAWNLAWPYWTGDQKWSARGLLGAVVLLNLISVWLNVRLNAWNAQFYNALQEYDWQEFWWQFAIFGMIAAALIVVAVYQLYLRQILQIRWRAWLTDRFLDDWLGHQTYYRMQLDHTVTDNPDQRISDDIDRYTSISLALSIGLMNSVVTLFSFLFILWTLSGILSIPLGGGRSFRYSGLHGVRRDLLCRGRHLADASHRQPAGPAAVRPAALRGRFPLQHGAAARERRERRVLWRREPRARRVPQPLYADRAELVGHHPPPQEADLVHDRLFAGGGRVSVHRRGAALFLAARSSSAG